MLRWCCLGRHEAAPPGPTNRQQQINFPLLLGLLAGVIRYTGGQGKTENSTPRKAAGSSVCWNLVPGSARVGGVCRGAPGAPRGAPGYPGSKTFILSTSGPRDLLQSVPRAISDRMVRVPSDFMSCRAILGRKKAPRALSTPPVADCGGRFQQQIAVVG